MKPLNEMTDDELSECFALEVTGWTVERRFPMCDIWKDEFKQDVTDPDSYYESPHFATSVDAVMPWLEQFKFNLNRKDGVWFVSVWLDNGVTPFGSAPTLARAACMALIDAKRRERK